MAVPGLSPYTMVSAAVAVRAVTVASLMAAPVLVMALVRRRRFCRYLCPTGLLVEAAGRLRPSRCAKTAKLPRIGQWVVAMALAGACVGYPLLLWLDPLAMFSACVGLWGQPITAAGLLSAACLPAILLLSVVWPDVWCQRVCPLGATQDLLALPKRLIRQARSPRQDRPPLDREAFARRSVLAVGLAALWGAVAWRVSRSTKRKAIRPPGARPEPQFAALCARCGNCVGACPAGIIRLDLGEHGVAGFLAPVLRFDSSYCREDCRRCTQVCPTGAIERLSLDEKRRARVGLAEVSRSLCILIDGKECGACQSPCPYAAITIVSDTEDGTEAPQVDAEKCTGCGACEAVCPTTPRAIKVVAPQA